VTNAKKGSWIAQRNSSSRPTSMTSTSSKLNYANPALRAISSCHSNTNVYGVSELHVKIEILNQYFQLIERETKMLQTIQQQQHVENI
jgi:hypothetical protein